MIGLHVRSSKVEFRTSAAGAGMKSGISRKKLTVQRIAMLETHQQDMFQCSRKMLFRPGRHGIYFIEGLRSSVRQSDSAKSTLLDAQNFLD
jgi:hypothetical protein